jgi:hypothetical protein
MLRKFSGLTRSVLVSTLAHVNLRNKTRYNFTTKRPLGTYHSALKREFYEESPFTNNGKIVYGQKVPIFNEPFILSPMHPQHENLPRAHMRHTFPTAVIKNIDGNDGLKHST